MPAAILKETPVLAFFVFVAVLCALPDNRDFTMPDHLMLFDHWWNFHHRLQEGELAQWNPHSGLGRIAVQWNHVPASVFTPFLLLSDLTTETMHVLHLVGTFLTVLALYLAGRSLGYGRLLPLLPVGLVLLGKLRYHNHPVIFTTFLLFYPLAVAALVSALSRREGLSRKWPAFAILSALALTGFRLEPTVHAVALVGILLGTRVAWGPDGARKRLVLLAMGVGAVAFALAANAWHFSIVAEATAESARGVSTANAQELLHRGSLVWIGKSLLNRPTLPLILLNALLLVAMKGRFLGGHRPVPRWAAVLVLVLQLVVLRLLPVSGAESLQWNPLARPAAPSIDRDLVFSWPGAASIVLSAAWFLRARRSPSRRDVCAFAAVLFCGFYAAEYLNTRDMLMPLAASSFLACGAVRLWLSGRGWMPVGLAIFHAVGEAGAYFLLAGLNVLWLPFRAQVVEAPFKVLLLLEAALVAIDLAAAAASRVAPAARGAAVGVWTRGALGIAAAVAGVAATAVGFPPRQIPAGTFDAWHKQIREAHDRSLQVRESQAGPETGIKRIPVGGTHNFLPCYSQRLNAATVYASEIPASWKRMFREAADEDQRRSFLGHPEISPALWDFLTRDLRWRVLPYTDEVLLAVADSNDALNRELCAAVGSRTPRVFLTQEVVRLPDWKAERRFLRTAVAEGRNLTSRITTSDRGFRRQLAPEGDANSRYALTLREDRPERIVVETASQADAYLVVMDAWSRGWRAHVDGSEVPIHRGYIGCRFVPIPAGRHTVEFTYRIPGLSGWVSLSGAAWGVLIGAGLVVAFRPCRRREGTPPIRPVGPEPPPPQ